MKKKFFAILFFTCPGLSYAQVDEGASLGVRAGVNFSFLTIKNATVTLAPGVNVGIFSKATIINKFSLQPELSASLQNSKITFNEQIDKTKISLSLYYAECAFLGVYNINSHLSVHAGPFISYLFNTSFKYEVPDTMNTSDFISRNNFYDINFGLIYGGSIEFKRFDLGARINHGLFIIGKKSGLLGYNDFLRTKNSFFQLYGAYIF